MYTKKILAVSTLCALFFTLHSLPLDVVKLVPINNLQRARRDVFSETINDKDGEKSRDAETKHVTDLEKLNNVEDGLFKGEKKEMLQAAADTVYPIVYRVRREYQDSRKYADSDNDYDDSDYAGYDRKGSEVGYMDANDDFPTVVW